VVSENRATPYAFTSTNRTSNKDMTLKKVASSPPSPFRFVRRTELCGLLVGSPGRRVGMAIIVRHYSANLRALKLIRRAYHHLRLPQAHLSRHRDPAHTACDRAVVCLAAQCRTSHVPGLGEIGTCPK